MKNEATYNTLQSYILFLNFFCDRVFIYVYLLLNKHFHPSNNTSSIYSVEWLVYTLHILQYTAISHTHTHHHLFVV